MTEHRAGKMDVKVEGSWNTENFWWSTWLGNNKNFWILNTLEWLKQWHFDIGDSLLIVSALKIFLFFLCFPFFSFATRKSGGIVLHTVAGPAIVWNSNLGAFLYNGIILLVLKIAGNIQQERDWLNRIASRSLFNSFRILVGILFDSSLLSKFKEEIILESWSYKEWFSI